MTKKFVTVLSLCALLLFAVFLAVKPAQISNDASVSDIAECWDKAPSWLLYNPKRISLEPAQFIPLEDEYHFAHGRLGWHTTWGILFDLSEFPPKAYESFDHDTMVGPFGRMEVPLRVQLVLKLCGVSWQGLWEGDWPERPKTNPQPQADPRMIWDLPIDELLPPRE